MRRFCVALVAFWCVIAARAAVNVGVHLDPARAASVVVPVSGGTLTATAADGTIFTLTIPANALLNSQLITMTPISLIDRLPMSGGLVGAVQLDPTGLQLWQQATLNLKTPQPIPLGAETPMAWHGGGNDLYLYPLQRDPNTISFKLIHFSGFGVGSGTSADRAAQQRTFPCDKEAAAIQQIAAILGAEREKALAEMPPDPSALQRVTDILHDYYTQTIKPAMDAALQSKDDAQLQAAISRGMSWSRNMALLGADNDPFVISAQQEIKDAFAKALQIRSDNASDSCVNEHKPEKIITILSVERAAQVLGLSGELDLRTQEKLDQCGKFELVFDSQIERLLMAGVTETDTMRGTSTVPLPFNLLTGWNGSAALDYSFKSTYVLPPFACSTVAQGVNDTFRVVKLELDLNVKEDEDPCNAGGHRRAVSHAVGSVPLAADTPFKVASMTIDVGASTESATYTCVLPPAPPLVNEYLRGTSLFPNAWHGLHLAENSAGNQYEIRDWSPGNGALLARRTYSQVNSQYGPTWTEVTTIDLFHRP